MTQKKPTADGDLAASQTRRRDRKFVRRRALGCALVLCLARSTLAASPPAGEKLPSGEELFGAMRAAIESVSSGVVDVEDYTSREGSRAPVKSNFRLVFDDGKRMFRCDRERLARKTKFARTPTESLFQLESDPDGAIIIGAPDRNLAHSHDQPLEPHLLWFAGTGGYLLRNSYSDVIRAWREQARVASVSKQKLGRFTLSWTNRNEANKVDNIQTLTIDPALGFAPVRNEGSTRSWGSTEATINAVSEIRYEKKNGCFVPVGLDIHDNAGLKILVTCHWASVNEPIDPKVFTVDGFEPKSGTPIVDMKGAQQVVVGVAGPAAPRVSPDSGAFWHSRLTWLLIANVVLLAVISALLLRRRRQRLSNKGS